MVDVSEDIPQTLQDALQLLPSFWIGKLDSIAVSLCDLLLRLD